jgi:hypothetical protein
LGRKEGVNMAYFFKDLSGNEYEITDETTAEEKIDIVTKEVTGYRAELGLGYTDISKETYEAIKSLNKNNADNTFRFF